MIEKLSDAATMFWQSLDQREKLLLLYGAYALVSAISLAISKRSKEDAEERIAARVAARLRA